MGNNISTEHINESRFWKGLWTAYAGSPSIALCRVPELEYAATLRLDGVTLDHCCGDGIFASMCWPTSRFNAGCDMNEVALKDAARLKTHERLDACDAGKTLPYPDEHFDLVFDNSAIEHVPNLQQNLAEIARVLKPGGVFSFNVLNHRYFEWWPLDQASLQAYREWQPFYHALSADEWKRELSAVGLEMEDLRGYFDQEASRTLAQLDCEFSGYFIRKRPSELVSSYNSFFGGQKRKWRKQIEGLTWRTDPDSGAGYFITARRL